MTKSVLAIGKSLCAICLIQWAQAASLLAAPPVGDVKLRDGGVLVGQVLDVSGKPKVGAAVTIRHENKEYSAGKTGKDGVFAVKGLRGGVYQLASADGRSVYRAWSPGTAPRQARDGAIIVSGGELTVRGQQPAANLLTHPLVIGSAIAGAVAVPVAIHSSKNDPPASP
jgi:hypothetical protein